MSGPKFLRQLFKVNPFELFTFVAAVLITFFTTVEYGIYVSVGLSIVVMLLRIARPRYAVLGRIPVQPTTNYYNPNDPHNEKGYAVIDHNSNDSNVTEATSDKNDINEVDRGHYIYVKQDHQTLSHLVQPPPPGVVIFRFDESLTYPNAGFISDKIMHYIQDNFNSGSPPPKTKGEQAWNDRRPLAKKTKSTNNNNNDEQSNNIADADYEEHDDLTLPSLHAIVLDCSAINHLDSTGVQTLLDLKLAVNRFAGYEVEWHFASLASPAIRNALITGGFGSQAGRGPRTGELLPVVPAYRDGPQCDLNEKMDTTHTNSHNHHPPPSTPNDQPSFNNNEKDAHYEAADLSIRKDDSIVSAHDEKKDEQQEQAQQPPSVSNCSRMSYVINIDGEGQVEYYPRLDRGLPIDRYPFFHWDLEDAVRSATYAKKKESSSS